MTQKEKIIEYLRGKEKAHLKDIKEATGLNPNTIRAIINVSVKKGEHFNRIGKGFYSLVEQKPKQLPKTKTEETTVETPEK